MKRYTLEQASEPPLVREGGAPINPNVIGAGARIARPADPIPTADLKVDYLKPVPDILRSLKTRRPVPEFTPTGRVKRRRLAGGVTPPVSAAEYDERAELERQRQAKIKRRRRSTFPASVPTTSVAEDFDPEDDDD